MGVSAPPRAGSPVSEALSARGQQRAREQEALEPPLGCSGVYGGGGGGAPGQERLRRLTQEPRDPGAQGRVTRNLVHETFWKVPMRPPAWSRGGCLPFSVRGRCASARGADVVPGSRPLDMASPEPVSRPPCLLACSLMSSVLGSDCVGVCVGVVLSPPDLPSGPPAGREGLVY